MVDVILHGDRYKVFNLWLEAMNLPPSNLNKCISIYRNHIPSIYLFPEAIHMLKLFNNYPKYVVTDGNKLVQERKVKALKLEEYIKFTFITHRYGVINSKPSIFCFEKIKEIEGCDWKDMIYVGDDPTKDFVNLNKKGVNTVRILSGRHKDTKAAIGYDASISIGNLAQLSEYVEGFLL